MYLPHSKCPSFESSLAHFACATTFHCVWGLFCSKPIPSKLWNPFFGLPSSRDSYPGISILKLCWKKLVQVCGFQEPNFTAVTEKVNSKIYFLKCEFRHSVLFLLQLPSSHTTYRALGVWVVTSPCSNRTEHRSLQVSTGIKCSSLVSVIMWFGLSMLC